MCDAHYCADSDYWNSLSFCIDIHLVQYVQGIQQSKLRLAQQSFGDIKTDQEKFREARLQVSILTRMPLKLQEVTGH